MDMINKNTQLSKGAKKIAQVNETIKITSPITHNTINNRRTGYLK